MVSPKAKTINLLQGSHRYEALITRDFECCLLDRIYANVKYEEMIKTNKSTTKLQK